MSALIMAQSRHARRVKHGGVGGCEDLIGAVFSFNLISTLQKMISRAVSCSRINIKVREDRSVVRNQREE